MAMPNDPAAAGITEPATLLVIGTTPPLFVTTYAVVPSGVIAIASGVPPTGMSGRGILVARSIGVTPALLTTSANEPSGVMAIVCGAKPLGTAIGVPTALVAKSTGYTRPALGSVT